MSDDKKRDRALQRRVRERQAKTGESYQAAWRQLTGDASAPPESTDEPEPTTVPTLLPDAAAAASPCILSLHLPRVLPHQPTRISTRATRGAVDVERIFISGVGTSGGASDWVVNDIEIDGRSQLAVKNLPGAVFGTSGIAANPHATTTLSLNGLDTVEYDREFTIVVTYIGQNPEGVPFYGSVAGSPPPQRRTILSIAAKAPIPAATKTTITARVQNAVFQTELLDIDDGSDWIVEDLRVNDQSQFAQSGSIPGDMFATTAIDLFVKLDPCGVGQAIEIDVIYVGQNEGGARFTARIAGTVVRDDINRPPPDLQVTLEISGQGPAETVVASCDWRATHVAGDR